VIVPDNPASTSRRTAESLPPLDRVRVRVERRHIDSGGHTATTCPIARAMGGGAFITKLMVRKQGDMSAVAVLPRVAREFVEAFDNGKAVEPIEFDLRL
jgi:hypothetical protein